MLLVGFVPDELVVILLFQWAPTLGGECYNNLSDPWFETADIKGFNGHPPLGVNATNATSAAPDNAPPMDCVSMGTHPWG